MKGLGGAFVLLVALAFQGDAFSAGRITYFETMEGRRDTQFIGTSVVFIDLDAGEEVGINKDYAFKLGGEYFLNLSSEKTRLQFNLKRKVDKKGNEGFFFVF